MNTFCSHPLLRQLVITIIIITDNNKMGLRSIQYLKSFYQISEPFKRTTFGCTDINAFKSIIGHSFRLLRIRTSISHPVYIKRLHADRQFILINVPRKIFLYIRSLTYDMVNTRI